ncbi:unnamed protein product [Adineta steineri]|uniref:Uncharacterized protein n=2 Tax=Adineta steineri TaxID=433720 RepID=A0A814RQS8_9BILA|nr:unnamed protein product [Adineta steineri]CAF1074237.1 unnamed protein product [Adineta steineri]CAF1137582.1 unnamed protein product [Adineta steineri]CAF3644482.1 unnamed protein product [Adineta steineri]CAF3919118.1 unnamed protein product [Adineta steineri]
MYLPERFDIQITEPVPSYGCSRPYSSVSSYGCHHPCPSVPVYRCHRPCTSVPSYGCHPLYSSVSYYNPEHVVLSGCHGNDGVLSETAAIRRELSELRNDIGDIKRQQTYPTYYTTQQNYPNNTCSSYTSSSFDNQQNPEYPYDEYSNFTEARPHTAGRTFNSKAPITTYQDHYRGPSQYRSSSGNPKRRTTLNEMQSQSPPSTYAQHSSEWGPAASKSRYPYRQQALSVPHPEP